MTLEDFRLHRVWGLQSDEIAPWPDSLLDEGCAHESVQVANELRKLWAIHNELYQAAHKEKRAAANRANVNAFYQRKKQERISNDPTYRPAIQTRSWTCDDWIKEVRSHHICETQTFKIVPPSRGKPESASELSIHTDGQDDHGNPFVRAWSKNYEPSKLTWGSDEEFQKAKSLYAAHAVMVKRMRTRNDYTLREKDALRRKRSYDAMRVDK